MPPMEKEYGFTKDEWASCLKVLEKLKDQPFENPDNQYFASLITKIHKQAKLQKKKVNYGAQKAEDIESLKKATLAKNALNNTTLYAASTKEQAFTFTKLNVPKNCYACNASYDQVHSFYHRLCPTCVAEHLHYRRAKLDLSGRNVLLTGGRVKIGYATALRLLRSQGNLLVTTRFPGIALDQFKKEKDYLDWKDRLEVYGLDLRNLKAVDQFIEYYKANYETLDVLINNAAQTIKYTDQYYLPIIQEEQKCLASYTDEASLKANVTPVLETLKALDIQDVDQDFAINRFGQPVDTRIKNSWNSKLEEISTFELLEVNLINQIAPYLLIKGFLPLLKQSTFSQKFIINVTSSEGQFSYGNKTIFHPHTNMTKAALNMMTRTTATDYAKENIYMNSVDVGWVSTGARETLRKQQFEVGYIPPLDSADGAARIIHPILEAIQNKLIFTGKLLKNFKIEDW